MRPDGQVLVGERSLEHPLFGGFTVFPGGMVQPEDEEVASAVFGESSHAAVTRATALRELFEEAGVYLDGQRLVAAPPPLRDRPFLEMHRAVGRPRPASASDANREPTAPALGSLLLEAGRWHTPSFAPASIDAHFFFAAVAETSAGLTPTPGRAELTNLRFDAPNRILEARARFEVTLALPTHVQLQALARAGPPIPNPEIAAHLRALVGAGGEGREGVDDLEVLPDIVVVPLKTPTLPPATHTNAYLLGGDRWVVVDPASHASEEREKLLKAIDKHARGRLEAIVLTHHHADHIGSAAWLAHALNVPIRAHPITRTLLSAKIPILETLDEGDTLDLGLDGLGRRFVLEVLFTPGHAPGHIVLVDQREGGRALIAGDMVAGQGSIIIDPPDGNMATYLEQLARLAALPDKILLPAHGPPVVGSRRKLNAYIEHRNERESLILEAVGAGESPKHPVDLLDKAYRDTPKFLHPIAARSCLAHLEKLAAEGRVIREGNRFRRVSGRQ